MQPIVSDTGYRHILMMKDGRAMIAGTRMKVEYIVTATNHHKLSPEEICKYWPPLTLGQVHSALAYYYDHKELVEHLLKVGEELAEAMRPEIERLNKEVRRRRESTSTEKIAV